MYDGIFILMLYVYTVCEKNGEGFHLSEKGKYDSAD